jgi:hypothetical protein
MSAIQPKALVTSGHGKETKSTTNAGNEFSGSFRKKTDGMSIQTMKKVKLLLTALVSLTITNVVKADVDQVWGSWGPLNGSDGSIEIRYCNWRPNSSFLHMWEWEIRNDNSQRVSFIATWAMTNPRGGRFQYWLNPGAVTKDVGSSVFPDVTMTPGTFQFRGR